MKFHNNFTTHLDVAVELIITDNVNHGKFPNSIEFELDFDGLTISRVISPANPAFASLVRMEAQSEIVRSNASVG